MKTNFKTKLYDLLKKDSRLWDEEKKELNETLLKDLIDKLDETLIELLLSDEETKEKFFIKVKDFFVFKQNELKFFIDENKLDNSYTQYQNKIGLRIGNKLLSERDEVVLDWPFKDCILEGGMTKEDQKRKEIFFNKVLAKDEIDRLEDPKALLNWKRYTAKGEEKVKELKRDKDGTIRENLIIKGNNLLALHTLKKQFAGKIKLIYIDPPYNTGNDGFKYNNNFNHSTWLTFMKNRLEVAKDLLRDDGVIFVQCDENEQAYLKVLMDDIFGRENFISNICVFTQASQNGEGVLIQKNTESILVYSIKKNEAKIYKVDKALDNLRVLDDSPSSLDTRLEMGYTIYWNKKTNDLVPKMDYDKTKIHTQNISLVYNNEKNLIEKGYVPIRPRIKDNKLHRWRWGIETFNERKNEIVIKQTNGNYLPYFKQRGFLPPRNIIDAGVGTKHLNLIFGEKKFDFPKPENLLQRIIEISTRENDRSPRLSPWKRYNSRSGSQNGQTIYWYRANGLYRNYCCRKTQKSNRW